MASKAKQPTELGRRILAAAKEAGMTPTSLQSRLKELGEKEKTWQFTPGHIFKIIWGQGTTKTRKRSSIDPYKLDAIARLLRVNFRWLAVGEGPMRPEGIAMKSHEKAAEIAREFFGVSDEAIDYVLADRAHLIGRKDLRYWFIEFLNEHDARTRGNEGATNDPSPPSPQIPPSTRKHNAHRSSTILRVAK